MFSKLTHLQWPLRWSTHSMMVHDIVLELRGHLGMSMTTLVLLDVHSSQSFSSAQDAIVQSRKDITL